MADNEKDRIDSDAPQKQEIPLTDDGIPMVANGQKLSETAIQALREARERQKNAPPAEPLPKEINGPKRAEEPTRYGDWEKAGRISDF